MGKLSLSLFAIGVAACGSDNNGTADAGKTFMDAPPKVFMDAPPKVYMDAPPKVYDFSCFNHTAPTTAPDPIMLTGTAQPLTSQTGVQSHIQVFNGTTSVYNMDTAADGTYTASIASGGHPVDGYVIAQDVPAANQPHAYRTTYVYPPGSLATNTVLPTLLVPQSVIDQLHQLVTQDDTTNGFLFVPVTDCTTGTPVPIDGATLTAKQNGMTAGVAINIGQFVPQLAGVWLVANVPDGPVTVAASYNNMTFPSHVVVAHKRPDANSLGTVTLTTIRPGP